MVPPVSIFAISKTAHHSQKIVFKFPENYSRNSQVFQLVIFEQNIQFFCLWQFKFEFIHFSARNIQIFKCPESIVFTISKSAHNSQRIISERQFSSKISTFCEWKFEVLNYPLFGFHFRIWIFFVPRESFQRKSSSKLNSQGMIFGRMTLRKITRFG